MSSLSLAERLAQLRENTNTSMISDCTIPTPLSTYLSIYNRATLYEGRCYTDYMAGAKILYKYLSPIEVPVISEDLLPTHIPALFHRYEIGQLAQIIAPRKDHNDIDNWFAYIDIVERTIIYLTMKDVIR